jgi:hypothetical protein
MAYARITKVLIGLALLTRCLQNVSGLPAALFDDVSPRSLTAANEETGVFFDSCEAPTTPASSTPAVITDWNTSDMPSLSPSSVTSYAAVSTSSPVQYSNNYPSPTTEDAEGFSTAVTTVDSGSTTGPSATSPTALATVTAVSLSGASDSATCEGQGNVCVGDVTHWDGGVGACGNQVNTNTTFAVALPYEFMGLLSNNNPYCGRSVTLYNPVSNTTSHAVVQDKCNGCLDRALDCTDVLFNQITDNKGNGRMSGIEWYLN